jgi:hypothetical protein
VRAGVGSWYEGVIQVEVALSRGLPGDAPVSLSVAISRLGQKGRWVFVDTSADHFLGALDCAEGAPCAAFVGFTASTGYETAEHTVTSFASSLLLPEPSSAPASATRTGAPTGSSTESGSEAPPNSGSSSPTTSRTGTRTSSLTASPRGVRVPEEQWLLHQRRT